MRKICEKREIKSKGQRCYEEMKGKQRKIVESREYKSWERGEEVKTAMTEDNTTKETADRET